MPYHTIIDWIRIKDEVKILRSCLKRSDWPRRQGVVGAVCKRTLLA